MTSAAAERTSGGPGPWPDGTRVLHIGLPKTGTSTVQTALFEHREALAEHGVVYAGRRRHSYEAAVAALGRSRPWAPAQADREWARLARQVRTSEARCVVLSSEVLSSARPDRARAIVADLGGDVQVLVTLRAMADVAASTWQQSLRNQSTLGLTEWLEEVLADPPASPSAQVFQRRFRVARYLREWGGVVGEEALTFVVPDPSDRGSLIRTVEGLLGLPASTLSLASPVNTSLPYPEAELLRLVAAAFEAQGGDHETWMRTIGSHRAKAELRALRTPLEPHPIRVPRWAAERANEWSRPDVEALSASRATVIGDPAHLLVDPSAYEPEPSVPGRMRIDAAAEMAVVLYRSALRRAGAPEPPALDQVPTRDLAAHLARRALTRLRRR